MKLNLQAQLAFSLTKVVEEIIENKIASRIANKDSTIWGPLAQAEAAVRLGWVSSAQESANLIPEILQMRDEFRAAGLTRFVLCGMGGSSLAPEVITKNSDVELVVLDSTDPSQVAAAIRDLPRTVVIVSSKSGSTVETDSQKRAFAAAFSEAGISPAQRILIVTDPGSPLDKAARSDGYRVFNADPNVGGRYSALTAFGLVPSGFAGADISILLANAQSISTLLASDSVDNPAIVLAAALARTASKGGNKDKFLIETEGLPGFGDWVEQLVAESTGKDDKGVLPVVVSESAPEFSLSLPDSLKIRFSEELADQDDIAFSGNLGELFLLWEYATAIAGWLLGIDPFNQPNVESAKVAARALLDSPTVSANISFTDANIAVAAEGFELMGSTLASAFRQLFESATERSYFSVQAYLNRSAFPEFETLRDQIALRTGRPTTFGWGPRFLHSTGQYHKGGPKQGIFIQIIAESEFDLAVPERPFTFGTLIRAQAAGDAKVLAEHGLKVLTLFTRNPIADLQVIQEVIG